MSYSKGVCWIGDCRIPFVDEKDPSAERYKSYRNVENLYGGYGDTHYEYNEKQGRFTPNLLVCDDMLNDGSVSKSGSNRKNKEYKPLNSQLVKMGGGDKNYEPNDKGTNSRYYDLDKWFDKVIDEIQ